MTERIYVVVPRNLDVNGKKFTMTCGRMAAHAAHAVGMLTRISVADVSELDLIVLACDNNADLRQMVRIAPCVEYYDTDRCFDGEVLTAVAFYPMSKEDAPSFLKSLRPWKCACNETQFPRSSTTEHSVLAEGILAGRQSGEPNSKHD